MNSLCVSQGGDSHPCRYVATIRNNPGQGGAPSDLGERRTWWDWMRDETIWQQVRLCQPWPNPQPNPHQIARGYRELYGRSPRGDLRRPKVYAYSRAEVLEVACWLRERQTLANVFSFGAGTGRHWEKV